MVVHYNKWEWGDQYIIVLDGGNALGRLEIENPSDKKGIISGISVIQSQRRKGLGDQVLKACEEKAKELGLKLLSVYVENNSWVSDWYTRCGYDKVRKNKSLSRYDKNIV